MRYIHQLPDWPQFSWQSELSMLPSIRYQQGRLLGYMENLGFLRRTEANLETLTLEVIKSSDIEGEMLEQDQVRSSIARHLGIEIIALLPTDKAVDGVVEMMLDATQNFAEPLSQERLFSWHASLFPTGHSGLHKIRVGAYRDDSAGPMQVISGAYGRERIHFEAPAAPVLKQEMDRFLSWFNEESRLDPVIKAGIAHLWFVTIHPFEDGNGRIARAISDMQLARSEQSKERFYSMSAQIRQERAQYYQILEISQKSVTLDITPWLQWFLHCLEKALALAESTLQEVLARARFWERHKEVTLNERQRLMLNKLLDKFEGKLTTSKWAKITKSSQDTALRDIIDLVERGILLKDPSGGRSTSYSIKAG